MRNKIYLIGFVVAIFFFISCAENKPTEVTVQDNNEDQVYNISPLCQDDTGHFSTLI